MKRLISLLIPLTAIVLSSCEKIDYTQKLETYDDNVFYAYNSLTGETHVSTHGDIEIIGDIASQSYAVNIKDVQLTENSPLLSCKVSNMLQLFKPKSETGDDKYLPLYMYFKQEGSSYTKGDLDVNSMMYCYLTGTYWLSFTSETYYSVWSTPRERTLYALKTTVNSPLSTTGILTEDYIEPGYKFTIDVDKRTVSIKAQGVKFPQDGHDVNQTLNFQSMGFENIPIEFSSSGYSFYVPELIPVINGKAAPEHAISELYGEIAFDYDGKKLLKYKMKNQNGDNILIESTLSLAKAYKTN